MRICLTRTLPPALSDTDDDDEVFLDVTETVFGDMALVYVRDVNGLNANCNLILISIDIPI